MSMELPVHRGNNEFRRQHVSNTKSKSFGRSLHTAIKEIGVCGQKCVLLLKEYNPKSKDVLFSPQKRYSVHLRQNLGEYNSNKLQQMLENDQNYSYLVSTDLNSVRTEHTLDRKLSPEHYLSSMPGKMKLYDIELMDENGCKAYVGKLMTDIEKETEDQTANLRTILEPSKSKSQSLQRNESLVEEDISPISSEDVMDSVMNNSLQEKEGEKRKLKTPKAEIVLKALLLSIMCKDTPGRTTNENESLTLVREHFKSLAEVYKIRSFGDEMDKYKGEILSGVNLFSEMKSILKLPKRVTKNAEIQKYAKKSDESEIGSIWIDLLKKEKVELTEANEQILKILEDGIDKYRGEMLSGGNLNSLQNFFNEEMKKSIRKLQKRVTKHMEMQECAENSDESEIGSRCMNRLKKELDELTEAIEKMTRLTASEQTEFQENIFFKFLILLLNLQDNINSAIAWTANCIEQYYLRLRSALSSTAGKQLTNDETCSKTDKTARKDSSTSKSDFLSSTSIADIEKVPHLFISPQNASIDLQPHVYRMRGMKPVARSVVCERIGLSQRSRSITKEELEEALSEVINQSVRKGALRDSSLIPPHVIDPTSHSFEISKSDWLAIETNTATTRQNVHPVSGKETESNYYSRFGSFSTWPLNAPYSALRLIDAGFLYDHSSSKIECQFCGIQVDCTRQIQEFHRRNMTAIQMHTELNSDCVHMKNLVQLRSQENDMRDSSLTSITSNINDLTISSQNKPREDFNNNCIGQIPDISIRSESNPPFDVSHSEQRDTLALMNGIQNGGASSQMSIPQNSYADPNSMEAMMAQKSFSSSHNAVNGLIHQENNPDISQDNFSTNYASSINEENEKYALKHPHFKTVKSRLETYKSWQIPEIQDPKILIDAGFYFTGNRDIVRCFCCDIGLAEWEDDDQPWVEHARHSPNCNYLKEKTGEEYINSIQTEWKKIYNPKHPEYNETQARIDSFVGWPQELSQTPDVLAAAGFFYTGQNDVARCHYCDGGLREWEPDDEPWTEHARWFPFCKYLMKVKGMGFIEEVAKRNDMNGMNSVDEGPMVGASVENGDTIQQSFQDRFENNADPLSTTAVDTLLCMGYTSNQIQYVINSFVRQHGRRNFNTEDLVEIIMDMEERNKELPDTNSESRLNRQNIYNFHSDNRSRRDIEAENRRLKSMMLCINCKEKDRNMVLIPCGHRLLCEQCSKGVKRCPTCKKRAKKMVKVFLA